MKTNRVMLLLALLAVLLVQTAQAFYNPSTGRWLSRDPIAEMGGNNLHGMLSNDALNNVDVLGMGPCEDKFKGKMKNLVKDISRFRKKEQAHRKEKTDRMREFQEDGGDLKNTKGGGKHSPKWPPSETRNGHVDLIDFHKAAEAAAKAAAEAAIQEFLRVQAEYVACRAAERSVKKIGVKCCKAVVKKAGTAIFFVWACATDGFGAAVDDALWPVSELWDDGPESMPSLEDVDLSDEPIPAVPTP